MHEMWLALIATRARILAIYAPSCPCVLRLTKINARRPHDLGAALLLTLAWVETFGSMVA